MMAAAVELARPGIGARDVVAHDQLVDAAVSDQLHAHHGVGQILFGAHGLLFSPLVFPDLARYRRMAVDLHNSMA